MPISDLVSSLLAKRGILESNVAAFLNPSFDEHLHDPLLLSDMQKAIERFFVALEKKERIAVYSDFDCDGVCGAAVFQDFFTRIGYKDFEIYLPHRDEEGYGFHAPAVKGICERGASLIITVDVGISGHEGVAEAARAGVDCVITDHHEAMVGVPPALAVVNPKLPSTGSTSSLQAGRGQVTAYPFPHLCGAAVAFKFLQAPLAEGKRRELPQFLSIPEGWEKWLLDVVAIATIADMVPLSGENRVLVHYGLRVLRRSRRPGLRSLAAKARMYLSSASEDDVGFSIAPRLNAASRMDKAELAFHILTTDDANEAERLAGLLEALNAKRKGIVASIVKDAKKRARQRLEDGGLVTVLGDVAWKPALLGLAANSVMNERGGVVCLWGRDASGALKGSCRSDGAISLTDLFHEAAASFLQYGGHAYAGGFSVSNEAVHTLQEALEVAASNATISPTKERGAAFDADVALPLSAISEALLRDVSLLSPFGIGNPKPVFHIPETRISAVRAFGKQSDHIEVTLECGRTGRRVRAFDFFKKAEHFTYPPVAGMEASVYGTLERDSYRGASAIALRIVDVLPTYPVRD